MRTGQGHYASSPVAMALQNANRTGRRRRVLLDVRKEHSFWMEDGPLSCKSSTPVGMFALS